MNGNNQGSESEKKTGFRIEFGFQNVGFSGLDSGLDFGFFRFVEFEF